MASFRYGLKPTSNNRVLIRAIIEHAGKELYKGTGYSIPANKVNGEYKYWNKKDYQVKQLETASTINLRLTEWKARWAHYIDECKLQKVEPDIEQFKASLDKDAPTAKPGKKVRNLLNTTQEFIIDQKGTLNEKTIAKYKVFENQLIQYQDKKKCTVYLEDVNENFYKDYGFWLVDEHNNHNNTINRKVKTILTIMNWAADPLRKYITTTDYKKKYRFKSSKPNRFSLRPDEWEKIKNYIPQTTAELLCLDAFRFACETTLRFSDVTQLKRGHLHQKEINDMTINVLDLTQIKTIHKNKVALSAYALEIWDRNLLNNTTYVFPINNSSMAGKTIKRIFSDLKLNRMCEIVRTQKNEVKREMKPLAEVISFHMSRNTAISFQLAKLSPATVMGNASIRQMGTLMGYYDENEQQRWIQTLQLQNSKPKTNNNGKRTTGKRNTQQK